MRTQLSAALLLVSTLASPAMATHNLVPNPSFEFAAPCPDKIDTFTGQIDRAAPWTSAGYTADLFHSCGLTNSVQVPANAFGSQCPWGADCGGSTQPGGYAGLVVWTETCEGCREYIQVPLDEALQAGVDYRVEYYLSLSEFSRYAVDRFGAYLSVGPVVAGQGVLPFVAQVEAQPGQLFADRDAWMKVSGKFTASGGEDHLVLGIFREDQELDPQLQPGNGSFDHAYYYLDMVSVREADITDITSPPAPGNDGGMWTTLAGAEPGSPAVLYCSSGLGGSQPGDAHLDIGPDPHVLATAVTDRSGSATFWWDWASAASCAGEDGVFFIEAAVGASDSGESQFDLSPATGTRSGARVRIAQLGASPNPFNPRTTVAFELPVASRVEIVVFDTRGRLVRRLLPPGRLEAGRHERQWDGRGDTGAAVASGVYHISVRAGDEIQVLRVLLLE